MGRVFANDPGDMGSIPGRVLPKTLKMVLDTIGFTLLYFKMAVIPFVTETKMVDVGKLIRKVTWFVLTTTSAPLILSRAFGADYMTRIAYIYSRLPRTHSLTFWLPETALSLSLSSFRLPETAWPCHLVRHNSIRVTWVRIHSTTFFFLFCLFG